MYLKKKALGNPRAVSAFLPSRNWKGNLVYVLIALAELLNKVIQGLLRPEEKPRQGRLGITVAVAVGITVAVLRLHFKDTDPRRLPLHRGYILNLEEFPGAARGRKRYV